MIIRNIADVKTVEWGNGLSRRFLLRSDGMGYSVTDTIVRSGSKSRLEYRNHLEACYCIGGRGEVIAMDGTSHPITPGTLYALDQHDPHYLVADPYQDLRLVCVFSPALRGDEVHRLDEPDFSHY
ncbi:ectoine synthase [Natronosporangium hydrolyticum]|uniref:L-ectoine synthase n=1 Tax=Natronosporangium hydrolyticum TaxID=2811111 RepID=A0A895YMU2_9ACTN|nr:ectoine synthase [Natronosporangium hydrolyticum]QSB16789.1 ectoine synthase [Natronosporangium hydrolyticum]